MRDRNQVVLPIDVGILIEKDDPARKLVEICDELDYSKLYETFLRHWRKVNPRTLFEIIVFAYMCGIYASREIEAACHHDIRFMWILNGEPVPDHSTIARNKYTSHNRNLTQEEEEEVLMRFRTEAEAGKIVEPHEIKEAFDAACGKETNPSYFYSVLKRNNWRKVMLRSRHPKAANEEACDASKK